MKSLVSEDNNSTYYVYWIVHLIGCGGNYKIKYFDICDLFQYDFYVGECDWSFFQEKIYSLITLLEKLDKWTRMLLNL